MKRLAIIIGLILCGGIKLWAYSGNKAIILANRNLQKDTIGYNILDDLSELLNTKIKSNEILLWESPEMKKLFTAPDLAKLEKEKGVKFSDFLNLFVYEEWSSDKISFSSDLKGFSFTGKSSKGEEMSFGYIQLDEKLRKILAEAFLTVNANGPFGGTVLQALENHRYEFDLVFFGDAPIQDFKKNLELKKTALNGKIVETGIAFPETRLVTYRVETGPSKQTLQSNALVEGMETFFNRNPQEFFNYGGDRILSHLKKSPIILSSFEVQELWTKTAGKIQVKPLKAIPYVMGIPLDPIPVEQFTAWKMKINGKTLEELLLKKNYYYSLRKINGSLIEEGNSESFLHALYERDWSHLLEVAGKPIPALGTTGKP